MSLLVLYLRICLFSPVVTVYILIIIILFWADVLKDNAKK